MILLVVVGSTSVSICRGLDRMRYFRSRSKFWRLIFVLLTTIMTALCSAWIMLLTMVGFVLAYEKRGRFWNVADCQTRALSMFSLPRNQYPDGSLVELVPNKWFGVSVAFRLSFKDCSPVLVIPLPLTVRSLAWANLFFFAAGETGAVGSSGNLYYLHQVNLIGGYLYLLKLYEKQKIYCRVTAARFNFSGPNAAPIPGQDDNLNIEIDSIPDICSHLTDFDMIERHFDTSLEVQLRYGMIHFSSFYDQFLEDTVGKTVGEKLQFWENWQLIPGALEIFSMSSSYGSWQILFRTKKNEVVHLENLHTSDFTVIFKATAYAVFSIGKKLHYIGVDEMQRLVFSDIDFKFARDIQIGSGRGIIRLFVVDELTVVAVSYNGTMYYSKRLITEVIPRHGYCKSGFAYSDLGKCMTILHYYDERYSKEDVCGTADAVPTADQSVVFSAYDTFHDFWDRWDYSGGKHEYFTSTEKQVIVEARTTCASLGARLIKILSKQKLVEISNLIKDKVSKFPNDYRIAGKSDIVFWVESPDDLKNRQYHTRPECCTFTSESAKCGWDSIDHATALSLGCCFTGTPRRYYYPEPCKYTDSFVFMAETTLVDDHGETIRSSQRMPNGYERCIAVGFNPLLGAPFAQRTYSCLEKYNFICEREVQWHHMPRLVVAFPQDEPIVAECTEDKEITYRVQHGCQTDTCPITCDKVCCPDNGCSPGTNATTYEWKFRKSFTRHFPLPGEEVSSKCIKSKPQLKHSGECLTMHQSERVRCHHWHTAITKEECVAHGCCFDIFIDRYLHNPGEFCYEKSYLGFLSGPFMSPALKSNYVVCEKPLETACEISGHQCHKNAVCVDDAQLPATAFTCHCHEGFTGNGFICVRLPDELPQPWVYSETTNTFYLKVADTQVNYYEAQFECQKIGATLLSEKSLRKMPTLSELTAITRGVQYIVGLRVGVEKASVNVCEEYFSGTSCTFRNESIHGGCFSYGNEWKNHYCLTTAKGYICEKPRVPLVLHVEMVSTTMDFSTYGYGKISVNGKESFDSSRDLTLQELYDGQVIFNAFDQDGDVVFKSSYKVTSVSSLRRDLAPNIPKAYFFGILTVGKLNQETSATIREILQGYTDVEFTSGGNTRNFYESSNKVITKDFYEAQKDETLGSCACASEGCKGTLLRFANGKYVCQGYFKDDAPLPHKIQVTLIQGSSYDIKVRLEQKEFSASATLQCPHQTIHASAMGVNLEISSKDNSFPFKTMATCTDPPCVLQLSCFQPYAKLDAHGDSFHTVSVFCRKYYRDVFCCPIREWKYISQGSIVANVEIPRPPGLAVYLNMDESLYLGAPSFATNSQNFVLPSEWRDLEWTWRNGSYPHVVGVGVKDRAVRFFGQEARTHGDPCWGHLGDKSLCPHGTSVSLWISVRTFPSSSYLRILDTGVWDMADSCGGTTMFIDPVDHSMHIVVARPLNQMWHAFFSISLRKWTHVVYSWSENEGLVVTVDRRQNSIKRRHATGLFKFFKHPAGTETSCESAMLKIGRYQDVDHHDGSFDLDELHIFPELLTHDLMFKIITKIPKPKAHYDCYEDKGVAYRGSVARTYSGDLCNKWVYSSTDEQITKNGLQHNYCRNPAPGDRKAPWCYVAKNGTMWGYCGVPECSDGPAPKEVQLPIRHILKGEHPYFVMTNGVPCLSSGENSNSDQEITRILEEAFDGTADKGNDKTCFDFPYGCLGSSGKCLNGFTMSFFLKINESMTSYEYSSITDDVVMSNIYDTDEETVGFSLVLTEVNSKTDYSTLELMTTVNSEKKLTDLHEFSLSHGSWHRIMVQMSRDGRWRSCLDLPTNCQENNDSNLGYTPGMLQNFDDPQTNLVIGPVMYQTLFVVKDVKFIEEDLDLVVAFDEFSSLPPAIHWSLTSKQFSSQDGRFTFEALGDTERINEGKDKDIDVIKLDNSMTNISSDDPAWLELSIVDLSGITCLSNIEECTNGFTIQFWTTFLFCRIQYPENEFCIFMTNMKIVDPFSLGFAVYRATSNSLIHVLVRTSKTRCELVFPVELEEVLFRFSWHPRIGLSLFLNGVLTDRTTPQSVGIEIEGSEKLFFRRPLTVGCSADVDDQCSSLKIHDLYYWDGIVEGISMQDLGRTCGPGYVQVGESCLWYQDYDQKQELSKADEYCASKGGVVASVLTPHHYRVVKSLIQKGLAEKGQSRAHIVVGLLGSLPYDWVDAGLTVFETNFYIAWKNDYSDERRTILTPYYFFKWKLTDKETVAAVCERPLFKDQWYRGCFSVFDLQNETEKEFQKVKLNLNAYGTYDVATACYQACRSAFSVAVVVKGECFCLLSNITNLTPSQSWNCRFQTKSGEFGLASFDGSPRGSGLHQRHCGPLQRGGSLRCGGNVLLNNQSVSNYTFTSVYGWYKEQQVSTYRKLSHVTIGSFNSGWTSTRLFMSYEAVKFILTNVYCTEANTYQNTVNAVDENCAGVVLLVNYDFGNGHTISVQDTAKNIQQTVFEHYYIVYEKRSFDFSVKALDINSRVTSNQQIQVYIYPRQERIVISHLLIDFGQPKFPVEVKVSAVSGNTSTCFWEFGDNSAKQKVKVPALPIPSGFHRYEEFGRYKVKLMCQNRVNSDVKTDLAVIDLPIVKLDAPRSAVIDYNNDFYLHKWRVFGGSNVICEVLFGNRKIPTKSDAEQTNSSSYFEYDGVTTRGIANLSRELYHTSGQVVTYTTPQTYLISVRCYNPVTDPIPIAITYLTTDVPIDSLAITLGDSRYHMLPNEVQTIFALVTGGTNVHMEWDFGGDEDKNIFEYCLEDGCTRRQTVFSYRNSGTYDITVTASNSISSLNKTLNIIVEYPVKFFTLEAKNVSQTMLPVEFILSHPDSEPLLPTPGVVDFHFPTLDGGQKIERIPLVFDLVSKELRYVHTFDFYGILSVTAFASNNVSEFTTSTVFQVGRNLSSLSVSVVSSRFLKTNIEEAVFLVTLEEGSVVTYTIKFGDENVTGENPRVFSENATRPDPRSKDVNIVGHYYWISGNYTCLVVAENLFGSLQSEIVEDVIIQNPLDGDVLLIPVDIPTIPFPPGNVTLDARLEFSKDNLPILQSALLGYADDVHVTWYLKDKVIGQDYGVFEADLFPYNVSSLTRSDVGPVEISARLENLVSFASYIFKFHLMEKVELIQVSLKSRSVTQFKNGTVRAIVPEFEDISFSLTTLLGSHISYIVEFGDGLNKTAHSETLFASETAVVVHHSYVKYGIYDITIVAVNDISDTNVTLHQAVKVYQRVSQVVLNAIYISKNNYDFLVDDFDSLIFEEKHSGSIFRSNVYFPLSKTIAFSGFLTAGSNVSFSWTLKESQISLSKSQIPGYFIVTNTSNPSSKWGVNRTYEDDVIYAGLEQSPYDESSLISMLFVRYKYPGRYAVEVTASNAVSSDAQRYSFRVEREVKNAKFRQTEPPLAFLNSNFTLSIDEVGTESCIIVYWGDLTSPVAFGFNEDFCLEDFRITEGIYNQLSLRSNVSFREGSEVISVRWSPFNLTERQENLSPELNITLNHTYMDEAIYEARVEAFNRVSETITTEPIVVIKVWCDYPQINIDKLDLNSYDRPRMVFKSLAFRLYTAIRTRCLITSITSIAWAVYKEIPPQEFEEIEINDEAQLNIRNYVKENFIANEKMYQVKFGLPYTNRSESVRVPPRFLDMGMHLICVNILMVGVPGIHATNCIFIQVFPTPLVAGILYGTTRNVGNNEIVFLDVVGASYDPDKDDPPSGGYLPQTEHLEFLWSFLVPINSFSGTTNSTEKDILFGKLENSSQRHTESICVDESKNLSCGTSLSALKIINVTLFNATSGLDCRAASTNYNCSTEKHIQLLSRLCDNQRFCMVKPNDDWFESDHTGDNLSGSGSGMYQMEGSSSGFESHKNWMGKSTKCFKIKYECGFKEDQLSYFESPSACISSGYFTENPEIQAFNLSNINESSCSALEVDTRSLQKNSSYIIFVNVKHRKTEREASSFQILNVIEGAPPILRIECLVNCKARINTFVTLSLRVICISCRRQTNLQYEWSLFKLTGENGTFVEVEDFNNLTTTGINIQALVLKPQSLTAGIKYKFKVVGIIPGYLPGLTEQEIVTNLPPYGGICGILPVSGDCLNTTFTVYCDGWKDEGVNVATNEPDESTTLTYKVWFQKENASQPYLLSSSNKRIISDKYFAPGVEKYDFWVTIIVQVVDEFGDKAEVRLTAQVIEAAEISEDVLLNLTDSTVLTSSAQVTSEFSEMAGELLNAQARKEINQSAGVVTAEEQMKRKESRSQLRAQLVHAITQKSSYDNNLEGIQQASSALKSLTESPDEVGSHTQISAVNALSAMTNSLSGIVRSEAPEEVEGAAANVVNALDLVVDAARQQVIADAPVSQNKDSPLYSLPPPSSASAKTTLDVEEEYLSPEERLIYREHNQIKSAERHAANRQQAEAVGSTAMGSIFKLSSILIEQKQPGEPPVKMTGKDLTVEIERKMASQLCSGNSTDQSAFKLPCGSNFLDGLEEDDVVDVELIVNKKNPFIWDDSADTINSDVVSLSLNLPSNKKIKSDNASSSFRIEIPITASGPDPEQFTFSPSGLDNMSYHEVTFADIDNVIFMTIVPLAESKVNLRLYFEKAEIIGTFPNLANHSFSVEVNNGDRVHPGRIRLDKSILGETGHFVFGILQIDDLGELLQNDSMTFVNYTIHTFVTSCRFWNETIQKWDTAGCVVSSDSNNKKVVCLCNHLTSFAADFFVAPNPIDFNVIAKNIANIANNLAVLLTLVVILVLYIVGVIFCRKQDKKDIAKWSISPLLDNKLIDEHFYQITVKTGKVKNSQTKSKIFFVVGGENCDTPVRHLSTFDNMKLEKGSVCRVIMSCERSLGPLSYFRIWHDNSGQGEWASWYLDSVMITDLQTNMKYHFLCDNWLAVDESEGVVERVMLVAGDEEMKRFTMLFSLSTQKDFSDGHLWFSLFSRPTKSHFTRVQRLSCAITLLFCTMLASAMFCGREEENNDKQGLFEIGPLTISVQQIMISIQSSFVVLPINILLVQIFRRLSPEKQKSAGVSASLRNAMSTVSLGNIIQNEREEERRMARLEMRTKFMFPHWCLYIAWAIVILVSLACAGVVFLYSIMWGATKSNAWLTSIFMSFTQSVFVIQPLKVIIVGVLFTLFVKKFATSKAQETVEAVMEGDAVDNTVVEDIQVMMKSQQQFILRFPEDIDETIQKKMIPPAQEVLNRYRAEMTKKKRMMSTAYEIMSYVLYVVLLLMASNATKDENSFGFHRSLQNVFIAEGDPSFDDVRTIDDFWSWCDDGLANGLFASDWYNGQRVKWSESRFISNRETFVVGPARLRQIRVANGSCEVPDQAKFIVSKCIDEYSLTNEESGDFQPFWRNFDYRYVRNESEKATSWMYQSFVDLGGIPFEGRLDLYGGGGYVATLGNTAKSSRKILADLKQSDWVDRYTKAVFVEFTVYNANINLFGTLILLFERSAHGGFEPYSSIRTIRLYEFVDGKGYMLVAIYLIFLAVLIYRMYKIIHSIKLTKTKYFKDFWNTVDVLTSMLSLITVAFYVVRFFQARYILSKIKMDIDKETFVNFQLVALWNDMFHFSLAFIVFFAMARFVRLLRFNKRIQMLSRTLEISAIPLFYFTCMFSFYFTAFLFLSWLWFEQKIYSFSTAILTAEQMIVMMLGKFDFTELKQAERLIGPVFFITFTLVCSTLLINMFIVILDESIKAVRADTEQVTNEFELVDFLKTKVRAAVRFKTPSFLKSRKGKYKAEDNTEDEKPFASPDYIAFPEDVLMKRVDAITMRVRDLEKYFTPEKARRPTIDELEAEFNMATF